MFSRVWVSVSSASALAFSDLRCVSRTAVAASILETGWGVSDGFLIYRRVSCWERGDKDDAGSQSNESVSQPNEL